MKSIKDEKVRERELWLILLGMCLQSNLERREYMFGVLPPSNCGDADISSTLRSVKDSDREGIGKNLGNWVGDEVPRVGSVEMVVEELRQIRTKKIISRTRQTMSNPLAARTPGEVMELLEEAMEQIKESERTALSKYAKPVFKEKECQDYVNKISGCIDEETKTAYTSPTSPTPNTGGDSGDVPAIPQGMDQGAIGAE